MFELDQLMSRLERQGKGEGRDPWEALLAEETLRLLEKLSPPLLEVRVDGVTAGVSPAEPPYRPFVEELLEEAKARFPEARTVELYAFWVQGLAATRRQRVVGSGPKAGKRKGEGWPLLLRDLEEILDGVRTFFPWAVEIASEDGTVLGRILVREGFEGYFRRYLRLAQEAFPPPPPAEVWALFEDGSRERIYASPSRTSTGALGVNPGPREGRGIL